MFFSMGIRHLKSILKFLFFALVTNKNNSIQILGFAEWAFGFSPFLPLDDAW
jgi:hypothetical protein